MGRSLKTEGKTAKFVVSVSKRLHGELGRKPLLEEVICEIESLNKKRVATGHSVRKLSEMGVLDDLVLDEAEEGCSKETGERVSISESNDPDISSPATVLEENRKERLSYSPPSIEDLRNMSVSGEPSSILLAILFTGVFFDFLYAIKVFLVN